MTRYWKITDDQPDFIIGHGDYRPDPNGPTYPHPSKMTDAQRASLGIAAEGAPQTQPDPRYYAATETMALVDGLVVKTWTDVTPRDLATVKAAKLTDSAAARYEKEIGGLTVSGVEVSTDRQTQSILMGARIRTKENASYTVKWKSEAGFVDLDADTIIALADAVGDHVQACFDAEDAHATAINAFTENDDIQDLIDYAVTY